MSNIIRELSQKTNTNFPFSRTSRWCLNKAWTWTLQGTSVKALMNMYDASKPWSCNPATFLHWSQSFNSLLLYQTFAEIKNWTKREQKPLKSWFNLSQKHIPQYEPDCNLKGNHFYAIILRSFFYVNNDKPIEINNVSSQILHTWKT